MAAAVVDGEPGDAIGRDAAKRALGERHQAGLADQQIDAEGKDGGDQYLAAEIGVVGARAQRQEQRKEDGEDDEIPSHAATRPNKPRGRRARTTTIGRKTMM